MKPEDLNECKKLMEKIAMLEGCPENVTIEDIRDVRESIIKLNKKFILIEKALLEKEESSQKTIPSQQELKRAEKVLITHLGLNIRCVRGLDFKGVKTLRELYEYKDLKKVRKIGSKSISLIEEVLKNFSQTLENAERQRRNIEENDEELIYLLSERTYKYIKRHYQITMLSKLYNSISAFCVMDTPVRKEVEELFENYK